MKASWSREARLSPRTQLQSFHREVFSLLPLPIVGEIGTLLSSSAKQVPQTKLLSLAETQNQKATPWRWHATADAVADADRCDWLAVLVKKDSLFVQCSLTCFVSLARFLCLSKNFFCSRGEWNVEK